NRSRSYIYTTAAPAAMCLAASAALRIVRDEPQRRVNLAAVSARLRDGLRRIGFDLGSAQAHIVPVILGRAELAVQASQRLFERGFMVPAIRQPTVASGKARLRISLMSSHSDQDIDELIEALAQIGRDLALF
ncbi:MAG: aminotransferase class I/II-fold pyridoxal phosphate-dependent enzyme, partial [Actinobacteria bacterium]|nr:aminotransferase class I/II-fold pyridoxal phosphate-dependent enzyme [Actinomycetota bacterium]